MLCSKNLMLGFGLCVAGLMMSSTSANAQELRKPGCKQSCEIKNGFLVLRLPNMANELRLQLPPLPELPLFPNPDFPFPELPPLPPLPELFPKDLPPLPLEPGLVRGFTTVDSTSCSLTKVNDKFVAKHQKNGTAITVRGQVKDGLVTAHCIEVERDGVREKIAPDNIPEAYRPTIEKLMLQAGK